MYDDVGNVYTGSNGSSIAFLFVVFMVSSSLKDDPKDQLNWSGGNALLIHQCRIL